MKKEHSPKSRKLVVLSCSGIVLAALALCMFQKAPQIPSPTGNPASLLVSQPTALKPPTPAPAAWEPGGMVLHQTIAAAPAWTVAYGGEFWRRSPAGNPVPGSSSVPPFNVGDAIERVAYAVNWPEGDAFPVLQTKTYAAGFDGQGLRLSPHRVATKPDQTPYLEADPGTEFRLETKTVRAGGVSLYNQGAQPVSWSILGTRPKDYSTRRQD